MLSDEEKDAEVSYVSRSTVHVEDASFLNNRNSNAFDATDTYHTLDASTSLHGLNTLTLGGVTVNIDDEEEDIDTDDEEDTDTSNIHDEEEDNKKSNTHKRRRIVANDVDDPTDKGSNLQDDGDISHQAVKTIKTGDESNNVSTKRH